MMARFTTKSSYSHWHLVRPEYGAAAFGGANVGIVPKLWILTPPDARREVGRFEERTRNDWPPFEDSALPSNTSPSLRRLVSPFDARPPSTWLLRYTANK